MSKTLQFVNATDALTIASGSTLHADGAVSVSGNVNLEDFPDPDTPVNTTIRSRGISTSMSFKLWTRAPRTTTNPSLPTAVPLVEIISVAMLADGMHAESHAASGAMLEMEIFEIQSLRLGKIHHMTHASAMNTIVIAYDGSEGSEAIFSELPHAGLPSQVEAHVAVVAESWAAPDLTAWVPIRGLHTAAPSGQTGKEEAMSEANALAEHGAARLRAAFPEWSVVPTGRVGSVAQSIVEQARDVSANVIFIGSHSRSKVGRFFLGSVSQKVAAEAPCSVRICRPCQQSATAPRLLVALDGSRSSQAAVRAVAARTWPAGTVVAVVNVIEPPLRKGLDALHPDAAAEIRRQHAARLAWLEAAGTTALRDLEAAGVSSEHHTLDGEPKSTLLEWAESWNADCLFFGASGLHTVGTKTLGTVASALAVRAHCSVEIVRP